MDLILASSITQFFGGQFFLIGGEIDCRRNGHVRLATRLQEYLRWWKKELKLTNSSDLRGFTSGNGVITEVNGSGTRENFRGDFFLRKGCRLLYVFLK